MSRSETEQSYHFQLPNEMWLLILEELNSLSDLYSVSVTCRLLSSIVAPLLYSDVRELSQTTKAVFGFLRAVAQKPHLALLVKRVVLCSQRAETIERSSLERDVRVLCRALLAMRSLVDLELGFFFPWSTLEKCTFRLKRFKAAFSSGHYHIRGATEPNYIRDAIEFLWKQPQISIFEWQGHPDTHLQEDLPANLTASSFLPNLHRIKAPPWIVAAMMPNHLDVESVAIIDVVYPLSLAWLSNSARSLDMLSVFIHELSFEAFPDIVTCLKALQLKTWPAPTMREILATEWYLELARFQGLRSFALTGQLRCLEGVSGPANEHDYTYVVRAMHAACPSLEEIELPVEGQSEGLRFCMDGKLWRRTGALRRNVSF